MIVLATQFGRVLSLPKRSGFSWKEEVIRAFSVRGWTSPFPRANGAFMETKEYCAMFSLTEATGRVNPNVAINALQGVVLVRSF